MRRSTSLTQRDRRHHPTYQRRG
uniref:Uncharacterized protein n=1 Tax=Rhizophora mucronata TaxID=61149 RepID=A0A2P2NDL0_RHIMU